MQSKKYLKIDQRVEGSGNDIINKLLEKDSARRFGTVRGGVEDVKNHPAVIEAYLGVSDEKEK